MRGKAEFLKNGRETLGITPAYAGKSIERKVIFNER